MAELDLSHHTLNNSSSKQKFSFPKTLRFRDTHNPLYVLFKVVVTASTMRPVHGAAEPPPSAMATRIWV
jgi:hypothetical protein